MSENQDPGGPRSLLSLDHAGWRWMEGKVPPSEPGSRRTGQDVCLPHCWNAAEEYIPGVLPRRGWATYQLDLDQLRLEADRELRLRCEGFYGTGCAWINRSFIGRFNGDFLGIDLDLTDAARAGANRITLHVCNRHSRNILPGIPDPDFHLYGGLGGGMHLVSLPRVRLAREDCQATMAEDRPGDIAVEIGMENHGGACATPSLQVVVRDPSGDVAATSEPMEVVLALGGSAKRTIRCAIPSPRHWSPETPCLYVAEATLRQEGRVRDRLSWTFGLRTLRFDAQQGLVLNGRPIPLRGVNRHENLPGFGSALPRPLHASDARCIREMGLNFVRLSHYPQSPAFLDACDRLGLLVYAELCSWKNIRGGGWLSAAESQLGRMIRRDRHHPSVILWGLGNEGRHRGAFLRLKALARSLDPFRPTIYAENHAYRARRKRTAGLTDVWGLNYEFDAMAFARSSAPTGCVLVSECANLPCARRGHWPAEAQQVALIRDAVRRVENAGPGAVGWTLWCFADYATPRRQRWFRECGVVDGWRAGKMAADWIRARHGPAPFLSVRGDWSFASGLRRRLYLVTNCAEVRISRADGTAEDLSTPVPDLYELDTVFDGGPIHFAGRHPGGTVAARLEPWGAPAAFTLQADPPMATEDRASPMVHRCALQVLDENGVAARGYEGEAKIHVPAFARASLVGGERLPVHGGRAVFYVEALRGKGDVALECALDGFPPQTARLSAEGRP